MHKLRDASGDAEADLRKQLEEIAGRGKVYVLGLGNTDRADDGAGILVAEALKKHFPAFAFSEHDGVEGVVLDISEEKGRLSVFFVDAASMHAEPGSIRLMTKDRLKDTEVTTHRVMVSLLASMLEKAGKCSAVIGIQPSRIEFRGTVSEQVKEAVDSVVAILYEVMRSRNRST